MWETALINMVTVLPMLLGLYWICLIVGGGLLLISAFAGHDSHADVSGDVSFDAHADVDVDVHGEMPADIHVETDASLDHADGAHLEHIHASSLASWFSIRFVIFFAAVFGLVGVVLTHLTDARQSVTLGAALVGGLVLGQGVHQLFRQLRRSSGDSTPRAQDYIDQPARVTVTITHPRKGEVALQVGRGERFVPAVAQRPDTTFSVGQEVVVVDYRGGIAEVVSREEHEFLTDKSSGGNQ